jgi:hypothetical protein
MVYNEKYAWMHEASFMDSIGKMETDAQRYSDQLKEKIAEDKKQHTELIQHGQGKYFARS